MYRHYYVNKNTDNNPNNNHEVHHEDCSKLPNVSNRDYLGYFNTCSEAVSKAKTMYSKVDGCAICCPECHVY